MLTRDIIQKADKRRKAVKRENLDDDEKVIENKSAQKKCRKFVN